MQAAKENEEWGHEVIKKLKEGKTESELIMEGYDMQTVELAKTVL